MVQLVKRTEMGQIHQYSLNKQLVHIISYVRQKGDTIKLLLPTSIVF